MLGTARYPSPKVLEQAVQAARPAMLTVSLRRQAAGHNEIGGQAFWDLLAQLDIPFLPNTAGCHTPEEVFTTAMMAREVFGTEWIKLELIGDDYTLQPDTLNMVGAAERLLREGFKVLPYCTEDLVLCRRLVDVGCEAVMPWAAPIGTGKGAMNPYALRLLRERLDVPMLVDAGIGLPSHACQVMEWGFDGVLLNTAVAQAADRRAGPRLRPGHQGRTTGLSGRRYGRARIGRGQYPGGRHPVLAPRGGLRAFEEPRLHPSVGCGPGERLAEGVLSPGRHR